MAGSKILNLILLACLCFGTVSPVSAGGVSIGTESITAEFDHVSIDLSIPTIRGLDDWLYQEYLNAAWRFEHLSFANTIAEWGREAQDDGYLFYPYQCITKYEVKHNQAQVLSLVTTAYQYVGGAHGLTVQFATNLDLSSKQPLTLEDAVQHPQAGEIILDEINRQIAEDPSWYFQDQLPVDYINEEDFYLTESGLVVFYQLYEIAPYAAGIREFVIPWDRFN